MACGMTVAPNMEAASRMLSLPSRRGMRPPATSAGSGGAMARPARKPMQMTRSRPMTSPSNHWFFFWKMRRMMETAPMMSAPANRGRLKRSCRAMAPPMTSARSVAAAMSSAWAHMPRRARRERRSPMISGRERWVTRPSLAEWYWMNMAMRLATTSTHTRR